MTGGVLVLGGTTEARALTAGLAEAESPVITSLAGRTSAPAPHAGVVRSGSFGGEAGLTAWLRDHRPAAVVDATHPYAARMAETAAVACAAIGTPRLRLRRPGWTPGPGDDWRRVPDAAAAAALLPHLARRAFLALGGGPLAAFAGLRDVWCLVRAVEPPAGPLPPHHALVLDRGPFAVDDERALLTAHRVDAVVSRDSGGAMTVGKLMAARELELPVVLLERPPALPGPEIADVPAALAWVLDRCL